MKKTILTIFGFVLALTTIAQFSRPLTGSNPRPYYQSNKINRELIYQYEFDKRGIRDSFLRAVRYYDSLGDLILNTDRLPNRSETITRHGYFYDLTGKLIKRTDSLLNDNIIIHEFEYDSNCNEITLYEFNKDTTFLTITRKVYNDQNRIVQLYIRYQNNAFILDRKYDYYPDNMLEKEEELDNKGWIRRSHIYEYDSALMKKSVYLENENGRNLEEEWFYNSQGQCTRVVCKSNKCPFLAKSLEDYQKVDQYIENRYNPDKTMLETSFYLDGKKVGMERHYYYKD
jgi:hypothetical protein